MTLVETNPIGITDAEMRVYVEYKKSLDDIQKKIHLFKDQLNAIESKPAGNGSLISIRTYDHDTHKFEEESIFKKLEVINWWESVIYYYETMYDDRKAYCKRISDILETLPKETLELLQFRYFDNMTLEEIAEKTYSNRQTIFLKLRKLMKFQLPE